MNTKKIKRNTITTLAKTIISCMPKNYFTTENEASRYMLRGDSNFCNTPGEYFTCGFSKRIISPSDINKKKYYIAGYDSNNPAENTLDHMYARAMYLDDNTGRGGIIICSLDAVGMSRKDINDIRKIVIDSKKIPHLKSINICCTHTHSAIDTQGLWGEKITKSGRDNDYMNLLKSLTAQAITEAYINRKNGCLYYSVIETDNLQFDCRTPDTYDKNITKLRFEAFDSGESIFLINFASHAELMGSKTKTVSADFPAYMIKEIEEKIPNSDTLFINGAIGGMISAKEIKKVYRHEIDCEKYTKEFGKHLAEIILQMNDKKEISPLINAKSAPVTVNAENFVLILARLLKVLNNDITRLSKRSEAGVLSEVGYIELGNKELGMMLIPGELFPELFTGEFLDENSSANGCKAEYNPLKNIGNAKHKFIVGLCNDELGYIIPENDFFLNKETPYINSGKDKFNRNHYEETNSTGSRTAKILLNKITELIESCEM